MKSDLIELCEAIIGLKSIKETDELLRNLLTPGELKELTQRLQILKLLKSGLSQREISEKLGVSAATITRGSRVLKYEASPYLLTLLK